MWNSIWAAGSRDRGWHELALLYLYVFRVVVVGSCLVSLALAWILQLQWLLMASACIAIGEFLESTYYIVVLKWAERSGRLSSVGS